MVTAELAVIQALRSISRNSAHKSVAEVAPPSTARYHCGVRNDSVGMPEIIDACERGSEHFGVIRVSFAGESATLEFGVEKARYKALKRILGSRPFAETPGIPHRYSFAGSTSKVSVDSYRCTFRVRIEGGRDARSFEVEGPTSLAANLMWFAGLKSLSEASALRRLT